MKYLQYIFYLICVIFASFAMFCAIEHIQGWFWKLIIFIVSVSLFEESFNNIQKLK